MKSYFPFSFLSRINRNILECKAFKGEKMAKVTFVLIETYWNVKANICQRLQLPDSVLIETYWNVKINEPNTEGGENTY